MKIKKIHYCWFGKNPLPQIVEKCIASWKKFCPDYEIIEWNESNFDVNCCRYVKEAYLAKKWAFVSDYARFKILYENGGVYVDTDVELIKSISDLPEAFVGFESAGVVSNKVLNSGLIRGAGIEDVVCKKMLDSYEADRFILEDGSLNIKTVCVRETEILQELGLILNGTFQVVAGTAVYPTEYFCPMDVVTNELVVTPNTYSIHHYSGSWLDKKAKFKRFVKKIMGKKLYMFLYKIKHRKELKNDKNE